MKSNLRRRTRQVALTVCALLMAVLTPLLSTSSAPVGFAGALDATLPVLPSSTQFDITGFLQSATLNCAAYPSLSGDPKRCGGTATINNHLIVIPAETIAILPASALTWAELFEQNPFGPPTQTGMALSDNPMTTYEFNVIGNRVFDANGVNGCTNTSDGFVAAKNACDRYIAGLVHISQQDLNGGAGYINYIDYTTGAFEVGGTLGVQHTGARVIINDPIEAGTDPNFPPTGRYTRGSTSPDGRFQVDPDNPTIASSTGYPMCIPRSDPHGNVDALCPESQRPVSNGSFNFDFVGQTPSAAGTNFTMIRMDNPANVDSAIAGGPNNCQLVVAGLAAGVSGCLDPRIQAPMEVGDYVTYAGSLENDGTDYISAHTVIDDVAIYTFQGTNPAYVTVEVSLVGTGGLTIFGAGEACLVASQLGNSPWTVFAEGVEEQTPLSIGAATIVPPTTTGTRSRSTPRARSSSSTSGTMRSCAPERIERPITCTSSCSAASTIISGVCRKPV